MIPIHNFAFDENLVRVVMRDDEPWFVGRDVCKALGIGHPEKAFDRLDEDEKGMSSIHTPGGEQSMIVVCEAGVYRLAFTSRKEEAKRFTRWVAHEVLPAIRRTGHYGTPPAAEAGPAPTDDPKTWPVIQRLDAVRLASRLYGLERGRWMWRHLDLPNVPPPPLTALDEARQCLRHLLDATVYDGGPMIRDCVERALDEFEEERALLLGVGVRVLPDRDGFMVANFHKRLTEIFAGTEWGQGAFGRVFRRLPGTAPAGPYRFDGRHTRGTFVSADLLDEDRALRATPPKGSPLTIR
jgi:hypothetical protein